MFDEKLLKKIKRLHFVGIGGSGMFPIVQIFLSRGYEITGSDNNESDIVAMERKLGIRVDIGHYSTNIEKTELVIYSAAISQDNPELRAAREQGIPTAERSDILGYLTRLYADCICVSGTHGKTTTTAMLTQILLEADFDPSAVIGGKLPAIGGYGRAGNSEIMTCEACEFVDTFLKLSADISVVLNVDSDHLDYFGTLDNIIASFHKFLENTSRTIIINGDDENTRRAAQGISGKKIITFGRSESNDYYIDNLVREDGLHAKFDIMHGGTAIARVPVSVPGEHNIVNALAAGVAALEAGVPPDKLAMLEHFRGAGRRFEVLGSVNGVTVADDYAHHPAELEVTIKTAKTLGYNKVWAVFQPFTYSRTKLLLKEHAEALALADHVVMSEIMGAREENTYNIYTKDLAELIPGSVWFNSFEEIAEYVRKNANPGDLVLTLGCGDIYKCARLILQPE